MATSYSDIYGLFLAGIKDFTIDRLFQASLREDAEEYMKPFLIRGLINFTNCKKDLEDRDDDEQVFNFDLTTLEKVILSNLMIVEWLTQEVNDILQMRLNLQDSDFKTYSEAQNLKEKENHLNSTREVVNRQMTKYSYRTIDWNDL